MTPAATLPLNALIGNARAGGFHLVQNCTGMGQECAAGFGEAYTASETVEELRAQVFFELENLLRERGLGDLAALGGAAEAARFRNSTNVTQLMYFHRLRLYSGWEIYIGTIPLHDATFDLSGQLEAD